MKKELFIESIEAIKKQMEHDDKFAKTIGKAFPEAHKGTLTPDNHFLSNALLKLLMVEFYDNHHNSWIEYFIYEKDFGKRKELTVKKAGEIIPLDTADDLYNLLVDDMALYQPESDVIKFGAWLSGHDEATVRQMYNDFKRTL